jgi:hypothetical protein
MPKGFRGRRRDIADGITKADVDLAIEEWKQIGMTSFHAKYTTNKAERYVIVDIDGAEYPAKAILMAARTHAGLFQSTLKQSTPWHDSKTNKNAQRNAWAVGLARMLQQTWTGHRSTPRGLQDDFKTQRAQLVLQSSDCTTHDTVQSC